MKRKDERKYDVPVTSHVLVKQGDYVRAGDKLVEGVKDPQDILHINGRNEVLRYLIDEVQKVYRSQGVNINDKHIETIVRQMLRRVRVEFSGDTDLLVGDLVDRLDFENINAKMEAEGGDQAVATAGAARYYTCLAEHGQLAGGSILPGDHQGTGRSGYLGQDRQAAWTKRECHHRQADTIDDHSDAEAGQTDQRAAG